MTVRLRGVVAVLAGLALGGTVAAAHAAASDADADAPRGAVGGITSPASGTVVLHVRATDDGAGLASAGASVDGVAVASVALGGVASVEDAQLPVPTTAFGDGTHQLRVTVTDAAGNGAVVVDQPFVIANTPVSWQSTAVLTLGSGTGASPAAPGGSGSGGGAGTVGGAGSGAFDGRPACAAPRLSMFLKDKPLRIVKRVPVLRKNGRYRFTGSLTCAVGGRRVHAPSGVVVSLFNQIGRRTYRKSGVTTRSDGSLTLILAYPSSRLLDFRYMSAGGATTRVRIRITVAKHPAKKPSAKKRKRAS